MSLELVETIGGGNSYLECGLNECTLERTRALYMEEDDPLEKVSGYELPPLDGLISLVASHVGDKLLIVKDVASRMVASIPILVSMSGISEYHEWLMQHLALTSEHAKTYFRNNSVLFFHISEVFFSILKSVLHNYLITS